MTYQPGKIRGLKCISNNGYIYIAAADHRSSLERMYNKKLSFKEMRRIKKSMSDILSSDSSALLLDPNYSIGLDHGEGLIVSLESTGTILSKKGSKHTKFMKGWDVSKIKKIGASAVKLVIYLNLDDDHQKKEVIKTVKKISAQCLKYDIPFLLEPITTSNDLSKKPDHIIESVKLLSHLGADVMKIEYPGELHVKKLNSICKIPWVLLSGGCDYKEFKKALLISCKNGCSGFVAGRSLWNEIAKYDKQDKLDQYLSTTVKKRLRELRTITKNHGKSIWSKVPKNDIKTYDWFKEYL